MEKRVVRSPSSLVHSLLLAFWRFGFRCCMRVKRKGTEKFASEGAWILAACHIANLDPVFISVESPRRISWMSRIEFFCSRPCSWILRAVGTVCVDRFGWARPAIRESLLRLKRGEVLGIFPEGEVLAGDLSVVRGGRLKGGAVLLAARSGVPILPVLVAGTPQLNAAGPWMPAKRGRLWIMAGEFMHFPPEAARRPGRQEGIQRLEVEFRRLYEEFRQSFEIPPEALP